MLFVSVTTANMAAMAALRRRQADGFSIAPKRVRNHDDTVDQGYAVAFTLRGRPVALPMQELLQ